MQYAGWVSGDTLRGCRGGDAVMMALWGAASQQQQQVGRCCASSERDWYSANQADVVDRLLKCSGWLAGCLRGCARLNTMMNHRAIAAADRQHNANQRNVLHAAPPCALHNNWSVAVQCTLCLLISIKVCHTLQCRLVLPVEQWNNDITIYPASLTTDKGAIQLFHFVKQFVCVIMKIISN